MSAGFRPAVAAWARGPAPILAMSPGWPRGLEAAALGMLGLIAVAAWVPGTRSFFHLQPALPLALLALATAYGIGVNAVDTARPFSPPALLGSAILYGALVQLFAWSLVLGSESPGSLAFANGPILVAAFHSLRVRPTPRFPWPLAGHATGAGVAYLLADPEHRTIVLVAGPLSVAVGLVLGPIAERLRRGSGLVARHVDAIEAVALEARAAEISGLTATLLELMQRGHDARSALSGALLDADQLVRLAAALPDERGVELRASAASLRATLERLRELVDTRRGLLSSSPPQQPVEPAVAVMPAVLFAVASARLRASAARLDARAAGEARHARARVAGGETSLYRMLEILLENGWQGDGVRGASRVDVQVSVEGHTGALAIAVRDDGPGFPPELLAAPLAPFVSTKPGALGLGLYTAERLARASGGSLQRENAPGGGGVVTLYLQLAGADEPDAAALGPGAPQA